MNSLIIVGANKEARIAGIKKFCDDFCTKSNRPKYIFGRNVYAESVLQSISIDGVIDDYATEQEYFGRPVVKSADVPKNALVLIVSGGRPFSARRRLQELSLENLDYFSFHTHSGLSLRPLVFNEGFKEDFRDHIIDYEWIYDLLSDDLSRSIFKKLVSFRLNQDIEVLEGFESREHEQYFEDFLQLSLSGETFVDVGGFNGYNSLQFIKHCANYKEIHVFEPESRNFDLCVEALKNRRDVTVHRLGLSSKRQKLRFDSSGSGSKISGQGALSIDVDCLDDILEKDSQPTLIKMDIEGAELDAIAGASRTISRCAPKLAISVYHGAGDFWRIPKAVLSLHSRYRIYMRHYTESIYETVMFFIPY